MDSRRAIAFGILLAVSHGHPDDPVEGGEDDGEDQEWHQDQNQCLAHADVERHGSRLGRCQHFRVVLAEPGCRSASPSDGRTGSVTRVFRRRREPLDGPDHRLDPFRRGIGRLSDGGTEVGYLTSSVRTWWSVSGSLFSRKYVHPIERADWEIFWTQQPTSCPPHVDGVMNDVDAEVAEWSRGEFALLGRTLRVDWLQGDEAERLLVDYPVPSPEGPGQATGA